MESWLSRQRETPNAQVSDHQDVELLLESFGMQLEDQISFFPGLLTMAWHGVPGTGSRLRLVRGETSQVAGLAGSTPFFHSTKTFIAGSARSDSKAAREPPDCIVVSLLFFMTGSNLACLSFPHLSSNHLRPPLVGVLFAEWLQTTVPRR